MIRMYVSHHQRSSLRCSTNNAGQDCGWSVGGGGPVPLLYICLHDGSLPHEASGLAQIEIRHVHLYHRLDTPDIEHDHQVILIN